MKTPIGHESKDGIRVVRGGPDGAGPSRATTLQYLADQAAINVGGQEVLPAKVTDSQYVVSPFASYRRKWRDFTCAFQVNVNNLFDKVTDQGTAYRYTRWTDPRQIVTTLNVAY